jgi:hypothetical protein
MDERTTEPVELERVRRDATCIITRVGLGTYELEGAAENVLLPESRVAWATVVHDLGGEGYRMVTPDEYAAETGLRIEEVTGRIQEGKLFAVTYGAEIAVPLPEKEEVFPDIDVPRQWAPSGVRLPEKEQAG